MIDCVHKETLMMEIIEVHARFTLTEILTSCQSHAQVIIGDPGGCDSSVDIQTIGTQTILPVALDKLDAITPLLTPLDHSLLLQPLAYCSQFSNNEYGPSLGFVGAVGPLLESGGQFSPDLLLCNTSSLVSRELGHGARPFITQHGTYSEGQISSGCSANCNQHFPLPIMQSNQGKVKCTWPGCTRFVKHGGLTRHVNETHRQKIQGYLRQLWQGVHTSISEEETCLPGQNVAEI
ncbi:hypothetical protein P692DRAFT_20193677 [Suillus brevipes Sb2]|nr:hypothetical protein P692DRAFT_20193677 [Suillus brevipes Sb2]